MVDYKTLRVPEDAYDAAKDSKHDAETWGEFLQRCADTRPEIREFVDVTDFDAAPDAVSLDANERQKIAEEVATLLTR